jgi:DNA-binding transcriptional MerR regulator
MSLTVSNLGAEVGLSAATVRYYERLGLLPAPDRTAAGYRQYSKDAIERLRFIKSAQRVGLRLREIGQLLAICDQGLCPCGHSEALLRQRMAEIDAQVAELQAVRGELARVVEQYPAAACHDPTATSRWCQTAFAGGEEVSAMACSCCGCPCPGSPCSCCGCPDPECPPSDVEGG